jgi:hypothetical protein
MEERTPTNKICRTWPKRGRREEERRERERGTL